MYDLLRKIHYEERLKLKNINRLLPIINNYTDWRSEVISWYNKWTEGLYKKQLFLYGDTQIILNNIEEIMSKLNKFFIILFKLIANFYRTVFTNCIQSYSQIQFFA